MIRRGGSCPPHCPHLPVPLAALDIASTIDLYGTTPAVTNSAQISMALVFIYFRQQLFFIL